MKTRWGIDLGGTKIEGVVLDGDDTSKVLCRIRVPTEHSLGFAHVVSQVTKLVEKMKSKTGDVPTVIGMGTPGTTDPRTGLLKNCNAVTLNGMPLKQSLEEKTGYQFIMSNDANCFAMAETHLGAVRALGYVPEVVIGLILGTGVGSGIVVRGQVINGLHGIGGEWGHNLLMEDGYPCYCGKLGCVETVIAGPALERYYREITGKSLKLREIATQVESDPAAAKTIDHLVDYFGRAVSTLINTLDPDVVVIGGGVGNIKDLYTRGKAAAVPHIFNAEVHTQILPPLLGDSAGVFGAAMLPPE